MSSDFVHLHCHTDFSLLDGACSIPKLVELSHRYKMRAVAITDHGNMFGAVEFYKRAKSSGVKPIIGMEGYIAVGSRFSKKEADPKYHHLILLAKNNQGYHNLAKLSSIGYLEGYYYRPRFDKETLAKHREGLIVTSACLQGEVAYHLARDNDKVAERAIAWYKEVFGEDYYLEVQNHRIPEQQKVNEKLRKLSRKYDLPLVATNDLHYAEHQDHFAHDVLLCIGTGKTLKDEKRFRFDGTDFYLKDQGEMRRLFQDFPRAIENTVEIAEKCLVELDFQSRFMPSFQPPGGKTLKEYFEELCLEGLKKRYSCPTQEAKERLRYEMDVILQMGFASYFLIVWDFVRFAKENGIPVGPGRGSAAGSLVAYCLGITDVDPLKYDLLFERFLNAERVSMPDIDIDFSHEGRDKVIQYVIEKYGKDHVAQIITFGTLAARGVLRDVARVLDIPLAEVDKIAKLVPSKPGTTLEKAFEEEPELKKIYEQGREELKQMFDIAKRLEGLSRHCSTHAAGVVIGSKPLIEIVPLAKNGEDVVTQYTMGNLEELGLLKMDFLGLKTLGIIEKAIQNIQHSQSITISPLELPLNDENTYRLLSRGDTKAVFQLESSGMRDVLMRLKPDCFEDIIALLALYRPGPLGSGMVDTYIRRKHGEEKIEYLHPLLEPILRETYGVILYQEQVMRIANRLSGFSLNEADNLRKAMGKKKPEVMEKFRQKFIEGAQKNGVSLEIAKEIYQQIVHFAGYGFNKSHSTAYAFITYQTAYLKANYPLEFMAAVLTCDMGQAEKVVEYVEECRRMGIEVLPPNVNVSRAYFSVEGGKIHFGLNAIKGVGEKAVDSILSARERVGSFHSLFQLCENVDLQACNRGVLEALIKSGAMDELSGNRAQKLKALDKAIRMGNLAQKNKNTHQMGLFGELEEGKGSRNDDQHLLEPVEELSFKEKLAFEKATLGFYLSGHPVEKFESLFHRYTSASLSELQAFRSEKKVLVGAMISHMKRIRDRNGNPMAFLTLEDQSSTIEAVLFHSSMEEAQRYLEVDEVFLFEGRISQRNGSVGLTLERIIPPQKVDERLASSLTLRLCSESMEVGDLVDLKSLLRRHRGNKEVFLEFRFKDRACALIKLSPEFFVEITDRLCAELRSTPFIQDFYFNRDHLELGG